MLGIPSAAAIYIGPELLPTNSAHEFIACARLEMLFGSNSRDAIRRIKEREFGRANENYAISRSKPGGEIKEATQRPALVFAACARVNEDRFTVGLRFRPFDKVGQIGCGRSLLPNFSEYRARQSFALYPSTIAQTNCLFGGRHDA